MESNIEQLYFDNCGNIVVCFQFSAVLKVGNKRFITSINRPYDDDNG